MPYQKLHPVCAPMMNAERGGGDPDSSPEFVPGATAAHYHALTSATSNIVDISTLRPAARAEVDKAQEAFNQASRDRAAQDQVVAELIIETEKLGKDVEDAIASLAPNTTSLETKLQEKRAALAVAKDLQSQLKSHELERRFHHWNVLDIHNLENPRGSSLYGASSRDAHRTTVATELTLYHHPPLAFGRVETIRGFPIRGTGKQITLAQVGMGLIELRPYQKTTGLPSAREGPAQTILQSERDEVLASQIITGRGPPLSPEDVMRGRYRCATEPRRVLDSAIEIEHAQFLVDDAEDPHSAGIQLGERGLKRKKLATAGFKVNPFIVCTLPGRRSTDPEDAESLIDTREHPLIYYLPVRGARGEIVRYSRARRLPAWAEGCWGARADGYFEGQGEWAMEDWEKEVGLWSVYVESGVLGRVRPWAGVGVRPRKRRRV
ncbi:MAG: hypothetical protein M1829_003742 [Trizodia sp. TS-e1964]|nr:MAG: hypothetical protein M1829_003742 [Trizodia sp. TS-e1964]